MTTTTTTTTTTMTGKHKFVGGTILVMTLLMNVMIVVLSSSSAVKATEIEKKNETTTRTTNDISNTKNTTTTTTTTTKNPKTETKKFHPIPSSHHPIYDILQVVPPDPCSIWPSFQTWLKRRSWKIHGKILPLLHFGDNNNNKDYNVKDTFVNLRVLWCKALTTLDERSPAYYNNDITGTSIPYNYYLLPKYSRWILNRPFTKWFPRWYHANIELRTVYLNQAIRNEMNWIYHGHNHNHYHHHYQKQRQQQEQIESQTEHRVPLSNSSSTESTTKSDVSKPNIRFIILGGGYDTRSLRILLETATSKNHSPPAPSFSDDTKSPTTTTKISTRYVPPPTTNQSMIHVYELDFPSVIQSKSALIKERIYPMLSKQQQVILENQLHFISIDLNDISSFRKHLFSQEQPEQKIDKKKNNNDDDVNNNTDNNNDYDNYNNNNGDDWYTIVVAEAVLMYLDPNIPAQLLNLCSTYFGETTTGITSTRLSFLFADRLAGRDYILDDTKEEAQAWLDQFVNSDTAYGDWEIIEWSTKPGSTRHLGILRYKGTLPKNITNVKEKEKPNEKST